MAATQGALGEPRRDRRRRALFVVTPDPVQPAGVEELGDERALWFNFQALSDGIDVVLTDERASISEHSRFLLRELQALLVEDGLLDNDDVAIVAARVAYPAYLRHSAYVCQPNRAFREGLTHLGFYTKSAIQPHVPRILRRTDPVLFTLDEVGASLVSCREIARGRYPTTSTSRPPAGSAGCS